jgi:hypothetical protein
MRRRFRYILCTLVGLNLWAQAPCARGVSVSLIAPGRGSEQSVQKSNHAPSPVPVVVLETPEQAAAARHRLVRSDEHERRNLGAQMRAAAAAEGQVIAAWAGALLSFAGTILLIFTLRETQKSTGAARDAADYAKETLHADRAWLCHYGFSYGAFSGHLDDEVVQNGFVFSASFQNFGTTPALGVACYRDIKIVDRAVEDMPDFDEPDSMQQSGVVAPTTSVAAQPGFLNDEETARFRNRETKIFLYCRVTYYDIYKKDTLRQTELCVSMVHNGGSMVSEGQLREAVTISPAGFGNTAS